MIVIMLELNSRHIIDTPRLLPVLIKVKQVYLLWCEYYQLLPKIHRYSLGHRIDTIFVEIIESISAAGFLTPTEKQPFVKHAIKKTDTLKLLLMVLWESKSLEDKKYINLSIKLEEIGKDLGGWNGQLTRAKANISPHTSKPKTVPPNKQNSSVITEKK